MVDNGTSIAAERGSELQPSSAPRATGSTHGLISPSSRVTSPERSPILEALDSTPGSSAAQDLAGATLPSLSSVVRDNLVTLGKSSFDGPVAENEISSVCRAIAEDFASSPELQRGSPTKERPLKALEHEFQNLAMTADLRDRILDQGAEQTVALQILDRNTKALTEATSPEARLDLLVQLRGQYQEEFTRHPGVEEALRAELIGSQDEVYNSLLDVFSPLAEERGALLGKERDALSYLEERRLEEIQQEFERLTAYLAATFHNNHVVLQQFQRELQGAEDRARSRTVIDQSYTFARQEALYGGSSRVNQIQDRHKHYLAEQHEFLDRNPLLEEYRQDMLRSAESAGVREREGYEEHYKKLTDELDSMWVSNTPFLDVFRGASRQETEFLMDRYTARTGKILGQTILDEFGANGKVHEEYSKSFQRYREYAAPHDFERLAESIQRSTRDHRFVEALALGSARLELTRELREAVEAADPVLAMYEVLQDIPTKERGQLLEDYVVEYGENPLLQIEPTVSVEELQLLVAVIENHDGIAQALQNHYSQKLLSQARTLATREFIDGQIDEGAQEDLARYREHNAALLGIPSEHLASIAQQQDAVTRETREIITRDLHTVSASEAAEYQSTREAFLFEAVVDGVGQAARRGDLERAKQIVSAEQSRTGVSEDFQTALASIVEGIEYLEFREKQGTFEDPRFLAAQEIRDQVRDIALRQLHLARGEAANMGITDEQNLKNLEAIDSPFSSGYWYYLSGAAKATSDISNAYAVNYTAQMGQYGKIQEALRASVAFSDQFVVLEAEARDLERLGKAEEAQKRAEAANRAFVSSIQVLEQSGLLVQSQRSQELLAEGIAGLDNSVVFLDRWESRLRTTQKGLVFAAATIASGGLATGAFGASAAGLSLGARAGILGYSVVAGTGAGVAVGAAGSFGEQGRRVLEGSTTLGEAGQQVLRDAGENVQESAKGAIIGVAGAGAAGAAQALGNAGRFGTALNALKQGSTLQKIAGNGIQIGMNSVSMGATIATAQTGIEVGGQAIGYGAGRFLSGSLVAEVLKKLDDKDLSPEDREKLQAQLKAMTPEFHLDAGELASHWFSNFKNAAIFSGIGSAGATARGMVGSSFGKASIILAEGTTSLGAGVGMARLQGDDRPLTDVLIDQGTQAVVFDILGNMVTHGRSKVQERRAQKAAENVEATRRVEGGAPREHASTPETVIKANEAALSENRSRQNTLSSEVRSGKYEGQALDTRLGELEVLRAQDLKLQHERASISEPSSNHAGSSKGEVSSTPEIQALEARVAEAKTLAERKGFEVDLRNAKEAQTRSEGVSSKGHVENAHSGNHTATGSGEVRTAQSSEVGNLEQRIAEAKSIPERKALEVDLRNARERRASGETASNAKPMSEVQRLENQIAETTDLATKKGLEVDLRIAREKSSSSNGAAKAESTQRSPNEPHAASGNGEAGSSQRSTSATSSEIQAIEKRLAESTNLAERKGLEVDLREARERVPQAETARSPRTEESGLEHLETSRDSYKEALSDIDSFMEKMESGDYDFLPESDWRPESDSPVSGRDSGPVREGDGGPSTAALERTEVRRAREVAPEAVRQETQPREAMPEVASPEVRPEVRSQVTAAAVAPSIEPQAGLFTQGVPQTRLFSSSVQTRQSEDEDQARKIEEGVIKKMRTRLFRSHGEGVSEESKQDDPLQGLKDSHVAKRAGFSGTLDSGPHFTSHSSQMLRERVREWIVGMQEWVIRVTWKDS